LVDLDLGRAGVAVSGPFGVDLQDLPRELDLVDDERRPGLERP
jgi:hypothetical protein